MQERKVTPSSFPYPVLKTSFLKRNLAWLVTEWCWVLYVASDGLILLRGGGVLWAWGGRDVLMMDIERLASLHVLAKRRFQGLSISTDRDWGESPESG